MSPIELLLGIVGLGVVAGVLRKGIVNIESIRNFIWDETSIPVGVLFILRK